MTTGQMSTKKEVRLLGKYPLCYSILFENPFEKVVRLLLFSVCTWKGSRSLLDHQYTQFLEALRPAQSIPCQNTLLNCIKQLLNYQKISSCVGAYTLLFGVGSLT